MAPQPREKSVDQYIRSFAAPTRRVLEQLRAAIREAAPKAREAISYGMPHFFQDGGLVAFAAYRDHIGLYCGSSALRAFGRQLAKYRTGKGTLRFPIDQAIPVGLVRKIVKFRVRATSAKSRTK